MARVAIVDDQELFREGLVGILDRAGIKVTGAYADGEAALAGMASDPPDVVLLDVMLGDSPVGLDLLPGIALLAPRPPAVILLSSFTPPYLVKVARERGARGYLPKDVDSGTLLAAIRVVTKGGEVFPSTSDIHGDGVRPPTAREIEIIEAVARGLPSKEIGPRLGIEGRTVESHLARMLARYSVESRTELVVLAARMGWITELPTGR